MSEVTLNVLDADRALHGQVHGSTADRLVASLAADPATIDDLALALGRFEQHVHGHSVFDCFRSGIETSPWDAGIVYIDLAARMVAYESTYSAMIPEGSECWHNGRHATEHWLNFHLADDWLLVEDVDGFEWRSRERRAKRLAREPLDSRLVIYGKLPEFLVTQLWARHPELLRLDDDLRYQIVRETHIQWLSTPRDDLDGRSPRDVMLDEGHEHLMRDITNQQHHWSILRKPPPSVRRESAAYRFSPFGTHEIVLYYDLVRELLYECIDRLCDPKISEGSLPAIAEHLQKLRQDWLNTPDHEDLMGRVPAAIIDKERRRLPEVMSREEAIIDPECPCCQALADEEMFGPAFWGLDGCNMDDDFAFSFYRTHEEWEAEQRRWEEFNRDFDKRLQERQEHGGDGWDDVPF